MLESLTPVALMITNIMINLIALRQGIVHILVIIERTLLKEQMAVVTTLSHAQELDKESMAVLKDG